MVRQAVSSGVRNIQLRDKELAKRDLYHEATLLRTFTSQHGVILIINDYVDIARAVNADGVHLGQDDLPIKEARKILGKSKIIGISTHSLRQALEAERAGADYIGFGPVFATSTKNAGRPKGIKSLQNIKRHVKIPVVAIGGITLKNAQDVINSGADALAIASAILSGDMKNNINNFFSIIKQS
jgi:thiamine-phosphate pyrophosphorylase